AGCQVVAGRRAISNESIDAAGAALHARGLVVALGYIMEGGRRRLGHAIERRIDVAESGLRQGLVGDQILIEQSDHTGEKWCSGRCPADDVQAALRRDQVAIVRARCCQRNIGQVARIIVWNARCCLPKGLAEKYTGAAASAPPKPRVKLLSFQTFSGM